MPAPLEGISLDVLQDDAAVFEDTDLRDSSRGRRVAALVILKLYLAVGVHRAAMGKRVAVPIDGLDAIVEHDVAVLGIQVVPRAPRAYPTTRQGTGR